MNLRSFLLWMFVCVVTSNNKFKVLDILRKKAVFPPSYRNYHDDARGHNKPLGWQRSPEGPVKECNEPLNSSDFWKQHVKPQIPLVYRNFLNDSPASKLWNDEYLSTHYGTLDVLVEHKLENRTSSSGRMRLAEEPTRSGMRNG